MSLYEKREKMTNAHFHMEEIACSIERDGLKMYDIKKHPAFRIYGVFHDGECYRRIPADVAENTNERVIRLSKNTAGGRVRFTTDSPYIVIRADYERCGIMTHMAGTGVGGFDVYIYEDGKEVYDRTFRPFLPENSVGGYEGARDFPDASLRTININFPLYNPVDDIFIGIKEGSTLLPAPDYKIEKPIVYYGSSITQGGCASRPGMAYEAHVTRRFDVNHINLGFAGAARAEDAIIDYIAGLDMSIFVYDYDHNAPTVEYLAQTHEKAFKRIREAHPTLPIVMMSCPKFRKTKDEETRAKIIKATYDNAKAVGDENVYFIDGSELCLDNDTTVDDCHPNDYGFKCMSERLIRELEKIIK